MTFTRRVEGYRDIDGGRALRLADSCAEATANYRPKLLTRLRQALRSRHYSRRNDDGLYPCPHSGRQRR